MNTKIKIIAEIGENHHGDWDIAGAMVEQAAKSGADIIKFQSYLPDIVACDDPEYDWFCRVSLPDEKHFEFKEQTEKLGAEFMSAPFSAERASFLCEKLKCKSIKVASGVLMNSDLLDVINSNADNLEDVYVSTGMATLDEIREALGRLNKVRNIFVLHCTTQYPAKPEAANLNCIQTLKAEFPDYTIGYSDHVVGLNACRVAVALGAKVLEKHFTFSKYLPGSDHPASMTPEQLKQLCGDIEQIELMLGTGIKQPCHEELKIRDAVRARFDG